MGPVNQPNKTKLSSILKGVIFFIFRAVFIARPKAGRWQDDRRRDGALISIKKADFGQVNR